MLENYAKWQLIQPFIEFLDEECLAAFHNFKRATQKNIYFDDYRQSICINLGHVMMPIAMIRLYIESALPEETKVR